MAFSPYLEQAMLKMLFGATDYTPSETYVVGLSFTDPIAVGVLEPTGGGYARVTVANNDTNWNAPVVDTVNGGFKSTNAATLAFPTASANWTNGTYNGLAYYFIYDSDNPSNLITAGALSQSKVVYNGDTPSFAPGLISITLV